MKLSIIIAVSYIIILSIAFSVNAEKPVDCAIYGRAYFYESGADGLIWSAEIDRGRNVIVEYNENLIDPNSSDIQKKTKLKIEDIHKLCKIFIDMDFFNMPMYLNEAPAPLHKPWFALEFSINGKNHRVELYYPKGMQNKTKMKQFQDLWKKIGDMMPVKPPNPDQYL